MCLIERCSETHQHVVVLIRVLLGRDIAGRENRLIEEVLVTAKRYIIVFQSVLQRYRVVTVFGLQVAQASI